MNFKTEPYDHQHAAFYATCDDTIKAIFWEMGLGKTWLVLNTVAHQFIVGTIDALLVFAPNGVHRNWSRIEIPRHLPNSVERKIVEWRSGKMDTLAAKAQLKDLMTTKSLAILCVNVEAVVRASSCRSLVERFLEKRNVFAVVDESIVIAKPGSQQTKALIALGRRAVTKRICSGVPISQGPLDLWSQFQFLREGMLGHRTFFTFKNVYAEWEVVRNWSRSMNYQKLVGYRNQDKLVALCEPYTLRATKAECLDLPAKIYQTRTFELADEQRRIYERLRNEYLAELDNDAVVSHVLTRLLRLQQITSNYYPATTHGQRCCDTGCERCDWLGYIVERSAEHKIGERNQRLEALLATLIELPSDQKAIIWCRFRADVDAVCSALKGSVRYDGVTSQNDRAAAIEEFQNGSARYFVGTWFAGGRGLTLTAASLVVGYSHQFSYEVRAQAEDRAHRIGQTRSVTYVDLVAEDTVDERLMEVVAQKRDLAALFDKPRNLLM